MTNIVIERNIKEKHTPLRIVGDITGDYFDETKTAFWGIAGYEDEPDLYLVSFQGVALARNPKRTWSSPASINILKWVDVEISIK